MAAGPSSPPPAPRTPFFYRRGARDRLIQGAYLAVTALVLFYVLSSLGGREYGFAFLNEPAALDIGNQWLIQRDGTTETRLVMYLVGVWSTIRVVLVAMALSTLLGIAIGVARLSPNWLVARLAMLFVEIFRNAPLFVQIVLWYAIILFGLPRIQDVIAIGDLAFFSNRGVAIPWPEPDGGLYGAGDIVVPVGPWEASIPWLTGLWALALAASAFAAWRLRRRRLDEERRTGRVLNPNRWALGAFAAGGLVSFVALGMPIAIDAPSIEGTNYAAGAGMQLLPEFTALLMGLTIYTAAFIAEIVRASIQALPRGQTEAANAIGLNAYQRLTLVILPQALRQMIPSVTNQYLNVTKNSSLAQGVGYYDLFFVANIIQNKIGHAVEIFFMIIVTYMLLSFVISAVMNYANARLTLQQA